MLFGFLIFVQVVVAFAMIFLVLLQGGKGAELGAAFGGMGQAQSNRGTMTGIAKVTAVVAAMFMITSLTLAYMSSEQADSSVVKGIKAPITQSAEETSEPASASSSATTEEADSGTDSETTSESTEQVPKLEQTDAPPPAESKSDN